MIPFDTTLTENLHFEVRRTSSAEIKLANTISVAVCLGLATAFFFMRIYVKLSIQRNVLVEDVTCILAWIGCVLYAATLFNMTRYGAGDHITEIPPDDLEHMLRWLWISSLVYSPASFFAKATLLLLVARVFAVKEKMSRAIRLFVLFLLLPTIPIEVLKVNVCHPIRHYWDFSVPGTCLDMGKLYLVDLVFSLLTDVVVLVVPVILTWSLTIPLRKKIRIMILLGAGGIATGISAYRLYNSVLLSHTKDWVQIFVISDIMTMLEITIGIICACLPIANILFIRLKKGKYSSDRHSPRTILPRSRFHRKPSKMTWFQNMDGFDEDATMNVNESQVVFRQKVPSNEDIITYPAAASVGGTTLRDTITSVASVERRFSWCEPPSEFRTITYLDGINEGWLEPNIPAGPAQEPGSPTRVIDIDVQLSRSRANRPLDTIWDGTLQDRYGVFIGTKR